MQGSLSTQTLAEMLDAELLGPADIQLSSIDPINQSGPGSLTFIRSPEYARKWAESGASAALVSRGIEIPGHDPTGRALIVVESADEALVTILAYLQKLAEPPAPPRGVHPSAHVESGATIDPSASVGPGCIVGDDVTIGPGSILFASVTLGRGCRIGAATMLHAGVVVYARCIIGDRCTLHGNVTIGADGFGYIPHPAGTGHLKIPHIGNVEIGNDVEIGAGSCIDRGKLGATRIGNGVKIDNLVQIAHNCIVGDHVVICGQSGLSGSSRVETGAMLGGQVGVKDNCTVGKGAMIGAQTGVMRSVPPGEIWFGTPGAERRTYLRNLGELSRLRRNLDRIEERIRAIESGAPNNPA